MRQKSSPEKEAEINVRSTVMKLHICLHDKDCLDRFGGGNLCLKDIFRPGRLASTNILQTVFVNIPN